MYSKLLAVVFLGALVRTEASKFAVRIPSIPGGIEARSLVGRQPTFATCDEQGLEVCGTENYTCLKPGYSCCDWGDQCWPGTFCDVPAAGESGGPGCCLNGRDCDYGGDASKSTASTSGVSVQAGFVGVAVVIAVLFAL